jgi:TIR domain/PAN domain
MAGKIFINYRRGDDPGNTGRLFDRLQETFQPEQLFMDVDNIAPGLDFVRVLEEQVGQCDALLVVIGKGWIDARDDTGTRRLDNPEDFVRIEIESALKQDKRVIPVLVGDTRMPRPEELPEAIRPLARRNAVRLSHERFRADAQGLIKALQRALEEVDALRQAHAEAAHKARAEEERKREEAAANARAQAQREAEEQARREKEQARLTAIAGLSADQIGKAEELANWDFIKASESAQEFRDHLARFPCGVTERFARVRLENLLWARLGASPGLDELGDFLAEFPQGTHAKTAADRRAALEQKQAEAEEALRRIEQQKVQRPSSAAARLIPPGRWRMVAGSAMALLLVGWIGLYQVGVPVWVPWAEQPDPPRADKAKAAADAEAQRKAAEAEQQRFKEEQQREAQAAADAEAKRKAAEVEQQRLAAVKAEEERKAKAAAEAEAKRKADQAEKERLAAAKAEEERKARVAAEAEARAKAEQAEKERLAATKAEEERRKQAEAEARARPRFSITEATAVRGEEYRIIRRVSSEHCSNQCAEDNRCKMFAYWKNLANYNQTCYLFNQNFGTYPTAASMVGTKSN